ncbi:MAG: hypothetical protein A4E57_01390 [Syntrophorhabdaceae bacterium PtaU1.Bin034]|nr:MAG: hypothetical protein A4E57_01390 [Syntrophorhabdaceae bacterium PtaU1.Bin034]
MLCEKCAQELETVACSGCGKSIVRMGAFCYECGSVLEQTAADQQNAHPEPSGEESVGEVDFSTRILCSDGTCIGIINEQGICKICGKPYTPES